MIKVSVHLLFLLESREIKMSFYVAKQFLFIVALFTEREREGEREWEVSGRREQGTLAITMAT